MKTSEHNQTPPASQKTAGDVAPVAVVVANGEHLPKRASKKEALEAVLRADAAHARRMAESARETLDQLVERLSQPCFAFDRSGKIVRWNRALAVITGLAPQKVLECTCTDVLHQQVLQRLEMEGLFQAGAPTLARFKAPHCIEGPVRVAEKFMAQRLQLIPLHHVPNCVEMVFVLLEPLPRHESGR
ncbi:MAG TPA: PAS domain-containing protein [Chthonomonas sp.]|uniref:PAS domain-containing protein n=1 Tax=Chthonomonas sp. TaxID=2282153 RepID=UPI002B4B0787|nr:PAS domain-containing protein [Chthonomonas sp.]HLI49119.1 PAS domain-containing protein [Chthonomonas sp.]